MRVLLINPPIKEGKYKSRQVTIPPTGIGYLASYLQSRGIDCSVIDGKMEAMTADEVAAEVIKIRPDLLGISAMTPDIICAAAIAAQAKAGLPGLPVVLGGPHAIALPEDTFREFPVFDYLVTGEGEETLFELIQYLQHNRTIDTIAGLAYLEGSTVKINRLREYMTDLDKLPRPAWEKFRQKGSQFAVLSARGCPFNCSFCMRAMGKKVRERSPASVVAEIEWLVNTYGAKRILFIDETFTLKKDRIGEVTRLLMEKGLHKKIKWTAQTRVDRADFELFKLMKASGCEQLEFGVESGNQQILNSVDKGIKLEQVQKAVALAKKAGLPVACTFILGHPFETESTIQDTINFAVRLRPHALSIGIMSPYPGTRIWEMAEKGEGNYRLLSTNWEEFLRFGGGCLELTNLTRHQLERLQVRAYLQFYLRSFKWLDLFLYGLPRWRQAAVLRKLLLAK